MPPYYNTALKHSVKGKPWLFLQKLHFWFISDILSSMEAITQVLPWIQIVLSVLLIIGILIQQSSAGVGGALGGTDGGIYHTRRGFEKFIFYFTIIIAVLFAMSALATVVL